MTYTQLLDLHDVMRLSTSILHLSRLIISKCMWLTVRTNPSRSPSSGPSTITEEHSLRLASVCLSVHYVSVFWSIRHLLAALFVERKRNVIFGSLTNTDQLYSVEIAMRSLYPAAMFQIVQCMFCELHLF